MLWNNKLVIERRNGYCDVFNDYEVSVLRGYLEGKSE